MKKISIIILCLFLFSSCSQNKNNTQYNEKNNELIEEYFTPISTGYKNDDGKRP